MNENKLKEGGYSGYRSYSTTLNTQQFEPLLLIENLYFNSSIFNLETHEFKLYAKTHSHL